MRCGRGRAGSLGARLALATVGVLLVLQAIGVLAYRRNLEERRAAELTNTVALGRTAAAVAEAFARDLERVTLAAALAFGRQEEPLDQASAGSYLRALLGEYPELRALFLTDAGGRVVASDSGIGLGVDLTSRPYVVALRAGAETVWSGSLDGLESGEVTVAFGRTVRGADGGARAYLVAAFYAARLAEGLPVALPPDADVAVIDEAGRLLYSSTRPNAAALPAARRDIAAAPGIAAALRGELVLVQGDATPLPDEPRLGVLVPVPRMRWVVAVTRLHAPLEAALRARFLQEAGAVAAVVLAAAALQVLLVRRLTRPLARLARAARAVAAGDPPDLAGSHWGAAGAEVDQLAGAMRAMSEAVEEREARLRDEAATLETLNRTGQALNAELDLQRVLQTVTDAATALAGARCGAFFYNAVDEGGGAAALHAVAGVPGDAPRGFPLPPDAPILDATLRGAGVLRLDDATRDPRSGQGLSYREASGDPVPVRSYLAVPVVSRSGAALGGVFLGHPAPGVFTARAERLVVGLAAQAAIAVDNARLYREAQRAVQLREEFLAVAAHELKSPITALMGIAQLAQRRLRRSGAATADGTTGGRPSSASAAEGAAAALEPVVGQARHLTRLVVDLLDVARLEQGRLALRPEATDLAALARGVLEAHRVGGDARDLHLAAPTTLPAVVDPLRLEQVLTNLVDNAIKYSPDGGRIEVEVSAAGRGEVRLTVRDHGVGIPPEERERVFERFYRAHAGRPGAAGAVAGGMGIGLYLTRQIVELHGGRVRAEAPGDGAGGTSVVVTLPARPTGERRGA